MIFVLGYGKGNIDGLILLDLVFGTFMLYELFERLMLDWLSMFNTLSRFESRGVFSLGFLDYVSCSWSVWWFWRLSVWLTFIWCLLDFCVLFWEYVFFGELILYFVVLLSCSGMLKWLMCYKVCWILSWLNE